MDSPIDDAARNGSATSEQLTDIRFTDRSASLQDTLFSAGLSGLESEADSLLESLREVRESEINLEQERIQRERESYEAHLAGLNQARNDSAARLSQLTTQIQKSSDEERTLLPEVDAASASVSILLSDLATKRALFPVRLLARRIQEAAILTREVRDHLLQEEEGRLEWEKGVHRLTLERREINHEESRRRVDLLIEQQARAHEQLTEHEQHIRSLRRMGVTRWTAGFLFWAGYLGFIGVGWFLGEALEATRTSQPSALLAVTTMFLEGLTKLFGQLPAALGFSVILLAPPLLLVLFASVVWGSDWTMQHFDPHWKKRKRTAGRQQRGFWAWMNDPARELTRRDFAQLLARLPTIYFWSLIPLLLAFLVSRGAVTAGPTLPDVSKSLLYTYFGVVICILCTGFCILYCTRIVEPRLRRVFTEAEPPSLGRSLSLNFELILLLIILASVFGAWELVPGATSPWASSEVAVGMLLAALNALVVAYASIYRGTFREFDLLRHEVRRYDDEIQRYSGVPLLEYDDDEVNRFRDDLRTLNRELETAWREFDTAARQAIPLPLDFGFSFDERGASPSPIPGLRGSDGVLEPELVAELVRKAAHRRRVAARLARVQAQLKFYLEERDKLTEVDWEERHRLLVAEMKDREREFDVRRSKLRRARDLEMLEALSALRAGHALRAMERNHSTPTA